MGFDINTLLTTSKGVPALARPVDRLFSQTLSFFDLEVLLLVGNRGAPPARWPTPWGWAWARRRPSFVIWCGAVCSIGSAEPTLRTPLPLPWSFAATVFQLTPMARGLRQDDAFSLKAFAASLGVLEDGSVDNPSIEG